MQKNRLSPGSVSQYDSFEALCPDQSIDVLNADGFPQNFVVYISDASNLPEIEFYCQGKKVDIHHLNAYLSYEDYWIDVHISKIQYKKENADLFDTIINSLKFVTEKEE